MPRRIRIAFPSQPSTGSDWETRSTAPGVFKAVSFHTQSDVDTYKQRDGSYHIYMTHDPSVNGDGTSGSAKTTVTPWQGAPSGQLMIPMDENIPDNTTFWVQVQINQSVEHAHAVWNAVQGAETDAKFVMISNEESSTGAGINHAIVIQNNWNHHYLAGYHWTPPSGVTNTEWEVVGTTPCGTGDRLMHDLINQSPLVGLNPDNNLAWTACEQFAWQKGPSRRRKFIDTTRKGIGDWVTGAFRLEPDEWMTVMFKVEFGNFGVQNTNITCYGKRQSASTFTPYLHVAGAKLGGEGSGPINAIWLLNYCTDRLPSQGRQVASRTNPIPGVTLLNVGGASHIGNSSLEYNAATQRFRWKPASETNYGVAVGFSEANGLLRRPVNSVRARLNTTLVGNITFPVAGGVINVTSTAGFPSAGTVLVSGVAVTYTGITATSLTGCTGGEIFIPAGSPVRNNVTQDAITYTTADIANLPTVGTVPVISTTGLNASGTGSVGGRAISYTGKTATTLTGVTSDPHVGVNTNVVIFEDYVIIKVDPSSLPTSGIHTETVAVANYRKEATSRYKELICSYSEIAPPAPF